MNWSRDYEGQEVPRSPVGKLETQESQLCTFIVSMKD